MRRLADGSKEDLLAVRARLPEALSNGPVEDFGDELQLMKR